MDKSTLLFNRAKNVPFTTIYGSEGKTEFVIYDTKTERSIRVESKYQATAGSVDEKYPYMLLNAISQYPEKEVILIVDGGGYKPGSRQWLKTQLSSNWLKDALIAPCSIRSYSLCNL